MRLEFDLQEVAKEIAEIKKEPKWMCKLREEAAYRFYELPEVLPELKVKKPMILTSMKGEGVPELVSLGEKEILAGIAAQQDAEVVYLRLKRFIERKGVIFLRMEEAVKKGLARKWFNRAVVENQITALNTALWSGGIFIYVPARVKVEHQIHAFFTMTVKQIQFERTILVLEEKSKLSYVEGCVAPMHLEGIHAGVFEGFVGKNAELRIWSLQNWNKNVVNIPFKRILSSGKVSWTTINLGSKYVHAYPTVVGGMAEIKEYSYVDGNKIEGGPMALGCERFYLLSKAVVRSGTISYTGGCEGGKGYVECEAIHLSQGAKSISAPSLFGDEIIHEARGGMISKEIEFYLRGKGVEAKDVPRLITVGIVEEGLKGLNLGFTEEVRLLLKGLL